MNRVLKKTTCILMALLLTTALTPVGALAQEDLAVADTQSTALQAQAGAVNPVTPATAVKDFANALSSFSADTSEMSSVAAFFTRFGGVASGVSGVIGVLQVMGILKDPTREAIAKVLDAINNMKLQLNQIDAKLDTIHQDLINVAVSQEEKDRNNKASTMLHYWNEFNTSYCEPIEDKIKEYEGLINGGIKQWWNETSHDGVRALYANVEGKPSLTYAKGDYASGAPKTADNGEAVLADASFGVPTAYMPNTRATAFDVNTYRDTFISQMASSFIAAANEEKLDATAAFYSAWSALSVAQKEEKAKTYASDILNSQIYNISCKVMTENDQWVITVLNDYRKYCANVLQQNSGANAMLNAVYMSHGFEGEAKDDINRLLDGLTVQAGYYGQFALSCACQDGMQSMANRKEALDNFANTVHSLAEKKKKAIIGHDNYCYVTGTVLAYDNVEVTSTLSVNINRDAESYNGYKSTDWKTTAAVPAILDNVYAQVLYRQYKAVPQGCATFMDYLHKYGTGVKPNFVGIMTRYGGASVFSLDEGLRMTTAAWFGDYFVNSRYYKINVGNDSDVEDQYFHVHDKVMYDTFDLTNGTLSLNQIAAARAFYGESHWYWGTDEAWPFWADGLTTNYIDPKGTRADEWDERHFGRKIAVLKSRPVKDINGDPDKDDPFFAFDAPSLSSELASMMGPSYPADERIPITDMVLNDDSHVLPAAGVAEPSVTVKAGDAVVPAEGYDLTFLDNDETGIATVTATGKGNYSGKVSRVFEITSTSTAAATKASSATPKTGGTSSTTPKTGDAPWIVLATLSLVMCGLLAAASLMLRKTRRW